MNKKRSKKIKFLYLFLVLVAIGVIVYLNLKKEKSIETFGTIPVKRGTLVDKLAETGTIELARIVEVKSTIAGEIRRLFVEVGDKVSEGQLLAIIEPDPTQALQLSRQRAAVEQARIDLQEQENIFARKKQMFEQALLSSEEFEAAERQLVRARNNLRLAELELEIMTAKANLMQDGSQSDALGEDEVQVLAPIAGIVVRREVEIGEVIASGISAFSGGTTLFHIGDSSQMIVKAEISEIDIGRVRVGQAVKIIADAYPDTTYQGCVTRIAPVGERKQGSTIVTFSSEIQVIDKASELKQGMSCDLDFIIARRDSALYLPLEAVLEIFDEANEEAKVKGRKGRFIAFVVTSIVDSLTGAVSPAPRTALAGNPEPAAGGASSAVDSTQKAGIEFPLERFEEVTLKVGIETATQVEILEGLKERDLVAANPEQIRQKLEQRNKVSQKAPK